MEIGYFVRFVRRDGKPDEEYFYRAADDAQRHFDMFADGDSGLYEKIEVVPLCAPCEAVLSRLFPVMGGGV